MPDSAKRFEEFFAEDLGGRALKYRNSRPMITTEATVLNAAI